MISEGGSYCVEEERGRRYVPLHLAVTRSDERGRQPHSSLGATIGSSHSFFVDESKLNFGPHFHQGGLLTSDMQSLQLEHLPRSLLDDHFRFLPVIYGNYAAEDALSFHSWRAWYISKAEYFKSKNCGGSKVFSTSSPCSRSAVNRTSQRMSRVKMSTRSKYFKWYLLTCQSPVS